jgi:hypothetical protein
MILEVLANRVLLVFRDGEDIAEATSTIDELFAGTLWVIYCRAGIDLGSADYFPESAIDVMLQSQEQRKPEVTQGQVPGKLGLNLVPSGPLEDAPVVGLMHFPLAPATPLSPEE